MSTEIKAGQIVPEHRASAANCRLNPGVSASGNHCYVCEPADATPAQLDASKVKAGDTVTVRVEADPPWTVIGEVTGRLGGDMFVGPVKVSTNGRWHDSANLTAHQPAPEPELEWETGTVAVATVRGMTNVRVMRLEPSPTNTRHHWVDLDGTIPDDSRVTDVRPLVVIDPAGMREKVAEVLRARMGGAVEAWFDYADAVLAKLGIEAP